MEQTFLLQLFIIIIIIIIIIIVIMIIIIIFSLTDLTLFPGKNATIVDTSQLS